MAKNASNTSKLPGSRDAEGSGGGGETTGTVVATIGGGAKPIAPWQDEVLGTGGEGVSDLARDNIVPFMVLLQKMSPQVDRSDDKYVEGAEPGAIWLRGHPEREIVPGDEGIEYQICHVSHTWDEWRPKTKGGGFVASYPLDDADPSRPPADLRATEGPNPDYPQATAWVLPSGNTVVETRRLAGFLLQGDDPSASIPYMISLTSTGHTFFKRLNNQLRLTRHANGERCRVYDRRFKFVSKRQTNSKGTFAIWDFRDLGWVPTREQMLMGKELREAMESGAVRAAAPDAQHDAAATDKDIPF